MNKFLEKDLKSVLKFGQKNPNATLDDWFGFNREHITKEELELYKDIHYYKFQIKGVDYFIFNYSSIDNYNSFNSKFIGNRGYIKLQNLPSEFYNNIYSIITFSGLDISKWDDYKVCEGIKTISDDTNTVMLTCDVFNEYEDEGVLEENLDKWDNHLKYLEHNNIGLWDTHSVLRGFINIQSIDKLNFKPIKELFIFKEM